jgi:hypothetical protein
VADEKKEVVTSTVDMGQPTIVAYGPSGNYGDFTRADFEKALRRVTRRRPKTSPQARASS